MPFPIPHLVWNEQLLFTELGVIGTFEDASSSTTEEPPTELEDWEYWSMKDSVLFCFTVITTIGTFPCSVKAAKPYDTGPFCEIMATTHARWF